MSSLFIRSCPSALGYFSRATSLSECPLKRLCSVGCTDTRSVELSYNVFDGKNKQTPLVLLHGLFGSKSNFQSIAKAFVQRTGREVITVDARNHGNSAHSPTITYEAMSLDLQKLLRSLQLTKVILVGHSMGGKTAMTVALQKPDLVERLVVVDIGPGYTTVHTSFPSYIAAMKMIQLDSNIPRSTAKRVAEDQLRNVITEPTVRQFLLTNLVEQDGQYIWRVNLDAIIRHKNDIIGFPEFSTTYLGPTLFLAGANSPYVSTKFI
ncbi:protein ABHD11 isoform X2 [Protopterus annectens]|uniref:protein ABHD11 isoform X2 n=1 Tax=Protopterus annectens TaxID=7888 RepID=UPI001CF97FC4|nr:protein ABHD11 isoform X2 [Protopterus annectens]